MLSVAKDQNGCRFLQRKFDEGGAASIALVFPEVLDNLIELMVDPFGNYLIQKLLDRCSEEQRLQVGCTPSCFSSLGFTIGCLSFLGGRGGVHSLSTNCFYFSLSFLLYDKGGVHSLSTNCFTFGCLSFCMTREVSILCQQNADRDTRFT